MKIVRYGILVLSVAGVFAACSQGPGADYTVKGNFSAYQEKDTRVYIDETRTEPLERDGIHDPRNDALHALQEPDKAMHHFPHDRRGNVDWAKAIDEGIIDPRASLTGNEEMLIMDLDIYLKDTGEMPWVRFPHLAHTRWLDCSNCHPAIFLPQKGANDISMDTILGGQHCGRCHDKVAFPLWTCERCHSVTHEGSPKAWWRPDDNPMPPTQKPEAGVEFDF